jgi:hypothetical protein
MSKKSGLRSPMTDYQVGSAVPKIADNTMVTDVTVSGSNATKVQSPTVPKNPK